MGRSEDRLGAVHFMFIESQRYSRLQLCAAPPTRIRVPSRGRRHVLVLTALLPLAGLVGCQTSNLDSRSRPASPERQVALEGQPNFRDLGGYKTADGRSVKWGLLYRAGALNQLTDADLEKVRARGIVKIIDLRADSEVDKARDRVPAGAQSLRLPVWPKTNLKALSKALNGGDVSGITEMALCDANRDFIRDFGSAYAELLNQLADPANRPTLWHCTLGKDRAGLGAAIVLLALGVPEKAIMEDYLLSNTYRAREMQKELSDFKKRQPAARAGAEASRDAQVFQALIEARREYLQAAFDEMTREYGSIEAYLHEGLGVTSAKQKNLQSQLLERNRARPTNQRR